MLLKKSNGDFFLKDDEDILYEFAQSELYYDNTRDEEVRLALFLSYSSPGGLDSFFLKDEFTFLFYRWCGMKGKILSELKK